MSLDTALCFRRLGGTLRAFAHHQRLEAVTFMAALACAILRST